VSGFLDMGPKLGSRLWLVDYFAGVVCDAAVAFRGSSLILAFWFRMAFLCARVRRGCGVCQASWS